MEVFEKILALLDKEQISYDLLEHVPVHTSEEAAAIRNTPLSSWIKAMVTKTPEGVWLLLFPANKKASWSAVKKVLNCKDVALLSPQEASDLTGVEMGSVPPFGNILDLPMVFDPDIRQNERVNFNIGKRTLSISMQLKDLERLICPQIIASISKEG